MSGHSKWHSIKHKKAKVDAQRGKMFTKCIRELMVAARAGGGDANLNPRLRTAISAAKAINMPNDNIERAIKKATGELAGVTYEEITYEGYAPAKVAVLVDCLTDNKNRTASEIRSIFNKYNGNLGASGCVSYFFDKKGLIIINDQPGVTEDKLLELTLDVGVDDIIKEETGFELTCDFTKLEDVKKVLEDNKIKIESASVAKLPKNKVSLSESDSEKIMKFIEALEENDDVQNVWTNADFNEAFLEKYE